MMDMEAQQLWAWPSDPGASRFGRQGKGKAGVMDDVAERTSVSASPFGIFRLLVAQQPVCYDLLSARIDLAANCGGRKRYPATETRQHIC